MLNEYLEFSRNQKTEETETVDIDNLITDVVKKYDGKQIDINLEQNVKINMRPNSIRRCLINLIDNGLSYGKKV